jgi:Holliday junction resolvase RusA-like endonuclease
MYLQIKPLSINKAFQGRRFKTKECKRYEEELSLLLPRFQVPEGDLEIEVIFGFSSRGADWENCLKVFVDVLQKVYNFNDNRIYKGTVRKEIVPKGKEYINFDIRAI